MVNLNQVIIVGKFVATNNNYVTIKIISEKHTSKCQCLYFRAYINNCTNNDIIVIKGNIYIDKNNNIRIITKKYLIFK